MGRSALPAGLFYQLTTNSVQNRWSEVGLSRCGLYDFGDGRVFGPAGRRPRSIPVEHSAHLIRPVLFRGRKPAPRYKSGGGLLKVLAGRGYRHFSPRDGW